MIGQLLADRFSCRGFTDAQVPQDTLRDVFAKAQLTPSWCNTQPWRLRVTSGDATTRLVDVMAADPRFGSDLDFPPGYDGVYAERRREVGWQLYEAVGVTRGDREASGREMLRNFSFFGAPHAVIVPVPESLGVYAAVDAGLWVQSFLLSAAEAGLATCSQAAIAGKADAVREFFGYGEDERILCGIALGYADPEHAANGFRAHRVPVEEAVTFHD